MFTPSPYDIPAAYAAGLIGAPVLDADRVKFDKMEGELTEDWSEAVLFVGSKTLDAYVRKADCNELGSVFGCRCAAEFTLTAGNRSPSNLFDVYFQRVDML